MMIFIIQIEVSDAHVVMGQVYKEIKKQDWFRNVHAVGAVGKEENL